MNYGQVNLDLQSVIKRAYANLLYNSTFMNLLNSAYLGEVRQAGTPMIEVIKQNATAVTSATDSPVMETAITPTLATYESVKVDLAELRLNYSFRVPSLVLESGIAQIIDGQIEAQDSEIAKAIDNYGFDKLADAITGSREEGHTAYTDGTTYTWNPTTREEYIEALNELKAILFNLNVNYGYKLGLEASEHAKFVSALTSVLKFETEVGVRAVDRGEFARAYGVEIFAINSNVLTNSEKGYFASEVGTVGDAFFTKFNEFNGSYPGFPGDYIVEGIVLFGAEVVRKEAIIKLVASA